MQSQPSPTPARRQFTHGTSAQSASGSPSPIRRAPPSYDSIRQSPEKSGKVKKKDCDYIPKRFHF